MIRELLPADTIQLKRFEAATVVGPATAMAAAEAADSRLVTNAAVLESTAATFVDSAIVREF